MQEVYKAIGRVAPQDVTVLILGESGTGKELVARAIYHYSKRADKPFLAINCAAIPENLLESELFGHEKGAFTGADRRRIGKFEQASGGTLFLDEIGDMTPLTQTKILRVLQGQEFERVGGNEPIRADVRVVAATNRDLEKMVAEGTFRGDLYYRLNVFTIKLPPLRDRGDDLPLLVEPLRPAVRPGAGQGRAEVSPEAMDLLRRYPWPGNVRELQSVVKQALLGTTGPVVLPEFLPAAVRGGGGPGSAFDFGGLTAYVEDRLKADTADLYAEYQALTDRHLLALVLRHTGGNLSQASRLLGITRATLRTKLAALGLSTGGAPPQARRRSDTPPLDSPPPAGPSIEGETVRPEAPPRAHSAPCGARTGRTGRAIPSTLRRLTSTRDRGPPGAGECRPPAGRSSPSSVLRCECRARAGGRPNFGKCARNSRETRHLRTRSHKSPATGTVGALGWRATTHTS